MIRTSAEATAATPYEGWAALLAAWQAMDVPDGWRAEIMGEGINVTPPPGHAPNLIAGRVDRVLAPAVPDGWEF